jgi:squalene-hopene/tetraprenyl-beta-curcumene cyclase
MPRGLAILGAVCLLIVGLSRSAFAAGATTNPVAETQIRQSISRSLPTIEADGVKWMQNHDCASCHSVSFMLWSHNLAKSRGIKVDERKLTEWTEWSAKKSLERRLPLSSSTRPTSRPTYLNDGGGLDTMAQLLLGRSDSTPKISSWNELVTIIPPMIVAWQEDDGRWKAAGQLPRQDRSTAESDAVATRWAILALSSIPASPTNSAAIKWGLESLKKSHETRSNESTVTALLLAHRLGAKAGDEKDLLADLLNHQNADGGWGWLVGGTSDAFATGQALYALARIRGDATTEAIARAQRYLLGTQEADGRWAVTGVGITSAKSTPARLKKVEPIYRQWGTAWATIGLASTLPEATGSRKEPDSSHRSE